MAKKTTIGLIQTKVFDNLNKNIENSVIKNEEAEVDKFCNNDSCEIPGEDLTSEN